VAILGLLIVRVESTSMNPQEGLFCFRCWVKGLPAVLPAYWSSWHLFQTDQDPEFHHLDQIGVADRIVQVGLGICNHRRTGRSDTKQFLAFRLYSMCKD
jgi:hypothetical protein